MKPKSAARLTFPLAAAIAALLAAPSLHAQNTYTWSTTTTGTAWLNAANWTGGPASTFAGVDAATTTTADGNAGDIASFSTLAFSGNSLGINFNNTSSSDGVTTNGNANGSLTLGALDLNPSKVLTLGKSDTSTIASALTLNGATLNSVANTILRNTGGNLVTIAGFAGGSGTAPMSLALGNTTNNVIQITGTGGVTISSILSGTGSNLTLEGGGTGVLTFSGANTYTGTTTLTAGTINLGRAENANVSGPLGTQLANAAGTIVLGGGRLQYSAANQFDYSGRFSTAINQAYNVDTNGQSVTWATNLASTGGTLTKTGAGNLTLSGTNSYDGGSTITTGALVFRSTDAKVATGTHAFAASTTLGLGVATSGSFFTSADVDNAFADTMTGNLSNVTVTATTNVGIDTTAGDFTYGTSVAGSPTKGLAKFGINNLTLTGANTYTGATNLNAGTLTLTAANNISTSSGLSLASGTTLQLRNDANTSFATPNVTTSVVAGGTYNFDVNQATVAGSGGTLTLGNITFATAVTGTGTNQINVTGGNSYSLALGTISAPSGSGGPTYPVIVNATTADVTIASFVAGSFGSGLTLQGGRNITLSNFNSGSNGANTLTVSGANTVGTLGTTSASNGRGATGSLGRTLSSGTLNLTTTTSLANVSVSGSAATPTFTINGGTLNNTNGAALTLAPNSGVTAGSPNITIGGSFTFGTAGSTNLNNLSLGGANNSTIGTDLTITLAGTGTTLTMPFLTNTSGNTTQTTTVNGAGNTLSIAGYNLSANNTPKTSTFAGSGNVNFTAAVLNGGGSAAKNLAYSGTGTLTLSAANQYTGTTAVASGNVVAGTNSLVSNNGAFGNAASEINFGLAGGNSDAAILTGGAFTIGRTIRLLTNNTTDAGTRVLTLGGNTAANSIFSGNIILGTASQAGRGVTLTAAASGQVTFSGVIQDPATMDATSYTVTKSGAGTVILSNSNTYTGKTAVNGGTLVITGASQGTSEITFGGGVLGLDTATPTVAAANATVDFTGQSVLVTGPTGAPSYTLLTALSIPGTAPTLAVPIPGYALQVVSNELRLVQTGGNTYATWIGGNGPATGFVTDSDNDGISNGVENVLGSNPNTYNAGLTEVSSTPTSVVFKHTLNPTIASDVTYSYQWSTDMVEWKATTETNTGLTTATISAPPAVLGVVTVTITITGGPSAKLFGRLNVVKAP